MELEAKGPKKSTLLDTTLLIDGKRRVTTIFSIIEFPITIQECIFSPHSF
ncbi:MAG: hypothetical protein Q8R18_03270 [bacterium]|nr:hypothetical protein [bacterium]